jgi:Family of unknown function (DUF6252)
MKFKYFPALLIAFALTLSACDSNDDDDGGDDGNVALGKMEANIDGTQWDASNATANEVSAGGFYTLTIAGAKAVNNNSSTDAMTISFANQSGSISTGTYTLGTAPLASMSYIDGNDLTKTFLGTTGTVTITKINDSDVVGTFSFEAEIPGGGGTVTITSGSFDVEFGISIGV